MPPSVVAPALLSLARLLLERGAAVGVSIHRSDERASAQAADGQTEWERAKERARTLPPQKLCGTVGRRPTAIIAAALGGASRHGHTRLPIE